MCLLVLCAVFKLSSAVFGLQTHARVWISAERLSLAKIRRESTSCILVRSWDWRRKCLTVIWVGYTGCLVYAKRQFVQGIHIKKGCSSYLVVINYLISSFLVLCLFHCPVFRLKNFEGENDRWLQDEMTAEHLPETETAGIGCQFRSSHSGCIRLANIQLRSMKLVHAIIPPAARHRIKPGPLGASDQLAE